MSKRSRILIVILITAIFIVFISFLSPSSDKEEKLSEWESEITSPENTLDPLNTNTIRKPFLIEVADKIESFIDKIFEFLTGLKEKTS